MAQIYSHDALVSLRSNPRQTGRVVFIYPPRGGHQLYDVLWDHSHATHTGISALDLEPAVQVHSAWELLGRNALTGYADFALAGTMYKVRNKTNNTVSSLRASSTLFKPYQYIPLIKFLRSTSRRLLIADEVGMGKTIEAGHILLELRGRKELNNALIICPKSLRGNWQKELLDRFNFDFQLFNSAGALANALSFDARQGQPGLLAIVTYGNCATSAVAEFLAANPGHRFDVVICDESHYLRNANTNRFRAVSKVLERAASMLFLTATPMMINLENFFNQVRLLESDRYHNYEDFQNAVELNKPFVRAVRALNAKQQSWPSIAADLDAAKVVTTVTVNEEIADRQESTIKERFARDPLYQRVTEELRRPGPPTPGARAQAQHDLSELNSLSFLYSRTRRRDVNTEARALRKPQAIAITLTEAERAIYDRVVDNYTGGFGAVTPKRRVTSSIGAFASAEAGMLPQRYDRSLHDSKFEALVKVLDDVVKQHKQKIILFSTFRDTHYYLCLRLAELGYQIANIHGGVKDRDAVIERFRLDPAVSVLLASEVGREGLNLQFCHALVNYDLPWNPMEVEQRIGRIDRVGQEAAQIHIYSFFIADTIEEEIFTRLFDRLNLFRESIGDLEAILTPEDDAGGDGTSAVLRLQELETALYTKVLSKEEQCEEIERVAKALEYERKQLTTVRDSLQDAVVNDAWFQDEVQRLTTHRRYLTPGELRQFIEQLLRRDVPDVSLRPVPGADGQFELFSLGSSLKPLFKWLAGHLPGNRAPNDDLVRLYQAFRVRHEQNPTLRLTFDSEVAYRTPRLEHINSYHPLVWAAAQEFEQTGRHADQAFRVGLAHEHAGTLGVGHYLLATYAVRLLYGDGKHTESLHAVLLDLNDEDGDPVLRSVTEAELLLGQLQEYATTLPDRQAFTPEVADLLRATVGPALAEHRDSLRDDAQTRAESSHFRRNSQQEQYLTARIARLENQLNEGRAIRPIWEPELVRFRAKLDLLKAQAEPTSVVATDTVVSLSHCQIF